MKPLSQRKLFLSGMVLMALMSAQLLPAYGGGQAPSASGGSSKDTTNHPSATSSVTSNPFPLPNFVHYGTAPGQLPTFQPPYPHQ
jgi:hypothetical protein